jgi:hypothetical protein
MINRNQQFISYYLEKDIMYTINQESKRLEIDHIDYYPTAINEQPTVFTETTDVAVYEESLDSEYINELYCKIGDKMIFFNEMYDEDIFNEATKNNSMNSKYKRLLYYDRIRNNREVLQLYKKVKADNPKIKKTFINYSRYKQLNLFVDLYYYNQVYLNNNNYNMIRSVDMYFEFIRRFIMDKRIDAAGVDCQILRLLIIKRILIHYQYSIRNLDLLQMILMYIMELISYSLEIMLILSLIQLRLINRLI